MPSTKNIILRINFYLSDSFKYHQRYVYNFIDLLGDLGGILEVIMVASGALFFPIAQHHYVL